MPTGYTADIAKGISFEQYVMGCARGFGACIMMRDEPADKPIPEKFEPNLYHQGKATESRSLLNQLESLTLDEAAQKAEAAYTDSENQRKLSIEKCLQLETQYQAMLELARNWSPPTPDHQALKDFLCSQIEESIKFDCETTYYLTPTVRLSGADWLEAETARLVKNIAYQEPEYAKELKRTESCNAWISALRESLK